MQASVYLFRIGGYEGSKYATPECTYSLVLPHAVTSRLASGLLRKRSEKAQLALQQQECAAIRNHIYRSE